MKFICGTPFILESQSALGYNITISLTLRQCDPLEVSFFGEKKKIFFLKFILVVPGLTYSLQDLVPPLGLKPWTPCIGILES